MELEDRRFLPGFQPEVPWDPTIVLVYPAIALPPVVELTGPNPQLRDEAPDADLGLLRPAPDEIHDLIPDIVRHPSLGPSCRVGMRRGPGFE
jgi:hypothetical protein